MSISNKREQNFTSNLRGYFRHCTSTRVQCFGGSQPHPFDLVKATRLHDLNLKVKTIRVCLFVSFATCFW